METVTERKTRVGRQAEAENGAVKQNTNNHKSANLEPTHTHETDTRTH